MDLDADFCVGGRVFRSAEESWATAVGEDRLAVSLSLSLSLSLFSFFSFLFYFCLVVRFFFSICLRFAAI